MNKRLFPSIGLLSASIVAFQLVIMQMLSYAQWDHFAYMVISIALLGFGASGTFIAIYRNWLLKRTRYLLPVLMLLTSLSMSTVIFFIRHFFGNFESYLLFLDISHARVLVLSYLAFFMPFFFGALAIGLVYVKYVRNIGLLYFSDLIGSGIGGLICLYLFHIFLPQYLPGLIAFLPLLGALLIVEKTDILWLPVTVLLYAVIPAVMVFHPASLQMSQYKSLSKVLNLPGAAIVETKPSVYGIIQLVEAPALRFAPGLSLSYTSEIPVSGAIFCNGEWFGPVYRFQREDSAFFMQSTTQQLPYVMHKVERVLINDGATGIGAAHAVSNGAKVVNVVEPNSAALNIFMKQKFDQNEHIYTFPEVNLIPKHSRSYLISDNSGYDLIVLPPINAFGGDAGIKATNEQYLFTLQALDDIWDRLNSNGMISVTVWQDYPFRSSLKMLALLVETLKGKGIDTPDKHIASIRGWGTITYVLKKSAISFDELRRIRRFCSEMYFDPLILPDIQKDDLQQYNQVEDERFFEYVRSIMAQDREKFYRSYPFNIAPPTDNQPFFGQFLKWGRIKSMISNYGWSGLPYLELGYLIVVFTFIQIFIIAIALILLPLVKIGWKGKGKSFTLVYFSCLGLGFMFFEIVLIQVFSLFFGNTIYAAAMVISGMLIFSGLGSLFSTNLGWQAKTISIVNFLVMLLIITYSIVLISLIRYFIDQPIFLKLLISFILVAPVSFIMGMPFPMGLRRLQIVNSRLLPWAWGINGCLSVISTVLATIIAIERGFIWVMLLAALSYAIASLIGNKPNFSRVKSWRQYRTALK
ncbi:MAG: hypothetical protein JJU28_11220 [Cyclobacteriaceae bacterium]|nr:hypothetical protein [Cyclobacteriaceae bacterium]